MDDLRLKEAPFMLFLDSLKAHKKSTVHKKVTKWLDFEANRLGTFPGLNYPFTHKINRKCMMPIHDPQGKRFRCIVVNEIIACFPWIKRFILDVTSPPSSLTTQYHIKTIVGTVVYSSADMPTARYFFEISNSRSRIFRGTICY